MRTVALTLVAALLVAGCLTQPAPGTAPGDVAVDAAPARQEGPGGADAAVPAPTYDLGHRWVYASETRNHSHLVFRVIGTEGDAWTLQNGRYVWNESKAHLTPDAAWGPRLRFPLAPGDAWTAEEGGEAMRYAAEAATAEAPAGRFDAVKVVKRDGDGRVRGVYHYADAVKRYVRLAEYDAGGALTRDLALVDVDFRDKSVPEVDAHGWRRDLTGANATGERTGAEELGFEVREGAQDLRFRFWHATLAPTQRVEFAVVTAQGHRWPIHLEGGAATVDVLREVPAGAWRVEAWAEAPQVATDYHVAVVIHY